MLQELEKRDVSIPRVDGLSGKERAQRIVEMKLLPVYVDADQGRRHGLGIRAQVPLIVDGRLGGVTQLANAGDADAGEGISLKDRGCHCWNIPASAECFQRGREIGHAIGDSGRCGAALQARTAATA
jgi:hypothetical protein